MTIDECYAELDLTPGASWDEIKRAHKLLATVWHPDRFEQNQGLRNQAERKLNRVNSAYIRLKDHFARGGPGAKTKAADAPAPPVAEGIQDPARPLVSLVQSKIVRATARGCLELLRTFGGLVFSLFTYACFCVVEYLDWRWASWGGYTWGVGATIVAYVLGVNDGSMKTDGTSQADSAEKSVNSPKSSTPIGSIILALWLVYLMAPWLISKQARKAGLELDHEPTNAGLFLLAVVSYAAGQYDSFRNASPPKK